MRSVSFVFIILILLTGTTALHAARLTPMTPHNAIKIIYNHIKNMRYYTLRHYFKGKEKQKLDSLIKRMKKQRSIYWNLKKQTNGLDGYGIVSKEVYKDLAAIKYYWIIKRSIPLKNKPHLHRTKKIKQFFEVMLVFHEKKWYAVASRALNQKG